ncbi:MAG: hypothetical protein E7H57_10710, partial [Pantoea sp.]|nr:hypothetical protein [Pantoea sp.]
YTQNNFNNIAPNGNDSSAPVTEKIFVAGYNPAQKTMAQHSPKNPKEQFDSAKNIVKNLRAVTDVRPSETLSENPAKSVDQPDGLLFTDELIARQENDGFLKTVAFNSVAVPIADQTDPYRDRNLSLNEEVTKRPHSFAAASTDAHAPAAPDTDQQRSASASESRDQIDGVYGGNPATGSRETRPTMTDAAKWPFRNMSGSTVQTDGARGGNPATGNREAESVAANAAQPLSGSPSQQADQKGGYQKVTENGKTSWVKVGQGNPSLFLSDGGRSYRGMNVPRNSAAAEQPSLSAASLSAASRAAAANAAQPPSVSAAHQAVQTDGARGGNPATDNRRARSAVIDAAKRPSGSMSGATVQTDGGARGGNPAVASLKAEPVSADATQPTSENTPGAKVQNGLWQKVIKNGKTVWINERQEQLKVSLSEAGVTYRRMNIPNVKAKNFN